VELDARGDEIFQIGGKKVSGRELRDRMLQEMRTKAAGDQAPHNKLYRPEKDGVATTFAGFIAAALGVRDPYRASRREREQIRKGHLLLAVANAMQPGVFSLSSWDLVGALPIPLKSVADRTADGDFRWVNRGGVDLMGANPNANKSHFGLHRAEVLYGSLPEQLQDPESFVSQLQRLLQARKRHRIAEGELLAVPDVDHVSVCILVLQIPGRHAAAVTAMNFSQQSVRETLVLSNIERLSRKKLRAGKLIDIVGGERPAELTTTGRMTIELPGLTASTFLIESDSE
jgi:maltose alpha-D-glucosyltransferase/alpha-amylase